MDGQMPGMDEAMLMQASDGVMETTVLVLKLFCYGTRRTHCENCVVSHAHAQMMMGAAMMGGGGGMRGGRGGG